MTLSFWRYSHLALAVFSAVFLFLASVTGTILAVDAIQEKIPSHRVDNFEAITLAKTLPKLRKIYPEITELSIDHNQFVILQAIDKDGNDINAYIDPVTGKVIGTPEKKSDFIKWITGLHRSLFLHETGRLFIGINAFLLLLIAISGFVLVLKRQKGLRNFFSKIIKEYFAQYYHVLLGRLALIPILIIALSGTYLSMERFHLFENENKTETKNSKPQKKTFDFKQTSLAEISKIEFPFSEDAEDYYTFELKDRKIEVEQYSNAIVSEELYPTSKLLSELSLDLHTGRANAFWAFVLGLASLNILFFIYSGFAMTFKRRASRITNKFKAEESKYILLVGSENGSSLRFANVILKELTAQGEKAFIGQMNNYTSYPKAEHLLIFTSTYGLGDAPSNATKFESLLEKTNQHKTINYSVIGFGSKSYPDFCGYAKKVDTILEKQSWANRFLELQTVNDKSAEEFVNWVKLWSAKTTLSLSTTPSVYNHIPKGLEKLMVLDKTTISENEQTFLLTLRAGMRSKFTSGDLLAIYPANDNRERLYSIGTHNGNIQLAVKLHPNGLVSGFLYNLNVGDTIKTQIIDNKAFHFPKKASKVALISNGTGIAPFLGMIEQNKKKTAIHLYSGFRQKTEITKQYQNFASEMIQKQQLKNFHLAYSREADKHYVMDLIQMDADFFAYLLANNGIVMICGALKMQFDVEKTLDQICISKNNTPLSVYKAKNQIMTDCY
ncbi:sulfite reductase (NADPH) flavoprotein alpha-component [Flavobacterium glycines]|uniref:NADPH--hemoprotein reductase n=1 Tax=Flavobacterium glycines TaxID=551990 RepID=A0A1B9DY21_9FLAO|nr:PepSY domain-containing protein [Flavobacterium glycines]OCB74584.1 FAD-binding oxidoreductase [Flavobacterium glycines]GEL09440.1 NADPH flavoprotein [Flavobacterium glycines]SDJ06673.1 sulfite reductase (NADPH) flavoprotein alpha-component [Flavobacterium glycines]